MKKKKKSRFSPPDSVNKRRVSRKNKIEEGREGDGGLDSLIMIR